MSSDEPTTTAPPAPEAAPAPASVPAPAPAPAPEPTPAAPVSETAKAALPDEPTTPLQELWGVAKAHSHPEIWGVTLADPSTHVPSQIVLQKYLNANDGDVVKARDQLTKTLDWRKKMQPLELIKQTYSKEKFGSLGYVTIYSKKGAEKENGGEKDVRDREIFTWNVYGNVKSIDVTFGDLDE
jgi:hypothetical protein